MKVAEHGYRGFGNCTESAKLLLEAGAAVEARDQEGRSSLHWAALGGDLEVVELLLRAGASRAAVDLRGRTPEAVLDPDGPRPGDEHPPFYRADQAALRKLLAPAGDDLPEVRPGG